MITTINNNNNNSYYMLSDKYVCVLCSFVREIICSFLSVKNNLSMYIPVKGRDYCEDYEKAPHTHTWSDCKIIYNICLGGLIYITDETHYANRQTDRVQVTKFQNCRINCIMWYI